MTMRYGFLIAAAAAALASPGVAQAQAQSLARRVADVGTGAVTFHYTARPGICGDGQTYVRTGSSSYHGSWSGSRMEPCVFGPVQVRLDVEDGVVHRVQAWVGPLRDRNATEIGRVPAPEAARYLMELAERGGARASAKAIFPAVLADSATVWPQLLAVARDRDTRARSTRQEARMWLARYASAAVAGQRNDPFADLDEPRTEEDELKTHAVFVLSQLSGGRGIPDLLEVARTNPNGRVRAQAMFWLGQSEDERALELFESVLR